MPGSLEDARKVYEAFLNGIRMAEIPRISDDEHSGSGRAVYRIGDVVYKLDVDIDGDNAREYACLIHFRDESWASPVSLYNVDGQDILCMPFYPDKAEAGSRYLNSLEGKWETWANTQPGGEWASADFHGGNYRADSNGTLKIIDAAGTSWEGIQW